MKFAIGMRVTNKDRGVGTVVAVDGQNKEFAYEVNFDKGSLNKAWLPESAIELANI